MFSILLKKEKMHNTPANNCVLLFQIPNQCYMNIRNNSIGETNGCRFKRAIGLINFSNFALSVNYCTVYLLLTAFRCFNREISGTIPKILIVNKAPPSLVGDRYR